MGAQTVWGDKNAWIHVTSSKGANEISLFFEKNIFDKKIIDKLCNYWSIGLRKELTALAKSETPNWFKVRFSKWFTPLEIRYSRRSHKLYVFGANPNLNVSNEFGKDNRKKIVGKRKPVFVRESHVDFQNQSRWYSPGGFGAAKRINSDSGFWFTPKKYQSHKNGTFKSRFSHSKYEIQTRSDGTKFYNRSGSRKYPFSAMWHCGMQGAGKRIEFLTQKTNVADWIFRYPQFEQILILTFANAINKVLPELKSDYVYKMTHKRSHHGKSKHAVTQKGWIEHHDLMFENNLTSLDSVLSSLLK